MADIYCWLCRLDTCFPLMLRLPLFLVWAWKVVWAATASCCLGEASSASSPFLTHCVESGPLRPRLPSHAWAQMPHQSIPHIALILSFPHHRLPRLEFPAPYNIISLQHLLFSKCKSEQIGLMQLPLPLQVPPHHPPTTPAAAAAGAGAPLHRRRGMCLSFLVAATAVAACFLTEGPRPAHAFVLRPPPALFSSSSSSPRGPSRKENGLATRRFATSTSSNPTPPPPSTAAAATTADPAAAAEAKGRVILKGLQADRFRHPLDQQATEQVRSFIY